MNTRIAEKYKCAQFTEINIAASVVNNLLNANGLNFDAQFSVSRSKLKISFSHAEAIITEKPSVRSRTASDRTRVKKKASTGRNYEP